MRGSWDSVGELERRFALSHVSAKEETTAGNYFVSNYPPYSFWTAEHTAEAHEALDRPPRSHAPLGIYVHIPFCRKRCHFCYFKVYTDKDSREIDRYLDAVSRELALYAGKPFIGGRKPSFIYFGGGTPSFSPPAAQPHRGRDEAPASLGPGRGDRIRV